MRYCKITLNVLGVLVKWEVEMFKLASKSRQRKCVIFSSFYELMHRAASVVCLSVCKLLRESLLLSQKCLDGHQTCTRWSPEEPTSRFCSRSRSRSTQRSRDTGTSVMSRNVCYTVRSRLLSLHALTLWSTIILSFQYKCQAARYNI